MKFNRKSFTNRFVFRSVIVVIGLFLTIYFLFNQMANALVSSLAEEHLQVRTQDNFATEVAVLGAGWRGVLIEDAVVDFLDLPQTATPRDSLTYALLSDRFTYNYVVLTNRGVILAPEQVLTQTAEFVRTEDGYEDLRLFFVNYYRANQAAFTYNENTPVTAGGREFFVRKIPTTYLAGHTFEEPPLANTILVFTEVTELLTFKASINQILITTLSISGLIILGMTLRMSQKFNQTIKKLANYAKELGHGTFDATIAPLPYGEFETLSQSMSEMATMLANYEVNQKQFFQNASHELRTPLMAVQCYSEGILADVFEPKEASVIINSEIERMTELVSSILYLSRIDHHDFKLTSVGINTFIENCYGQIKILADNNGKTITFNPLNTDILVNVDKPLLDRAVSNILSNALRYAKREIVITIDTYLNRNIFANIKQNMVRIQIFNDGDAVGTADLPHLFKRFYKGQGGNTGIGLSITKEIINALGGSVSVQNVSDGVCFTFDLPVYDEKDS